MSASSASDDFNPAHPGPLRIGFLFFDGYELLDSAGPLELFGALAKCISDPRLAYQGLSEQSPVECIMVAETKTIKTPVSHRLAGCCPCLTIGV